ncbi:MAG: hypothetical protein JO001_24840 [Alphaproteobacteria bacterium]|nr:hypothetical protein [Alphaproteobacteria bacterium]
MAKDLFHYDQMVEQALRGVVRDALRKAGREGLRSEHHFYIGFATQFPGVSIPDSLRSRYPEEMTIVLQHQFWDLEITEENFSVTLSFQKQLERLSIPLAAVRSFADPSVNFALEFASAEAPAEPADPAKAPVPLQPPPAAAKAGDTKASDGDGEKQSAEVVTLDSFRKR